MTPFHPRPVTPTECAPVEHFHTKSCLAAAMFREITAVVESHYITSFDFRIAMQENFVLPLVDEAYSSDPAACTCEITCPNGSSPWICDGGKRRACVYCATPSLDQPGF